ncbi:hypothetical protein SAMN04487928_10792 [Butyrivibrio proteoclasticus]|uniref:Uncharacterized protein n=1 Tax=Butyrivibrio proteoclasticus TaxID=43305 RepID=A0A1I5SVX6_9FIRM|nr:hypothetical protein [Butyrivibrio proteoclasticus]SFP74935.1 hypothetical protein SAMN04487928_10792 [Butyrivibrio proteoclasticus]
MSKNKRKNAYYKSKKEDKNSAFGHLMISIIILGVVVLLFINVALPIIKEGTKKIVAEKTVDLIEDNIDKIAADHPEVKEALESLSEEDRETVTEIIADHIDTETAGEVMEYVNEGDKDGLMEYAVENLSPEEISKLAEIYGRYSH